MFHFLKVAPVLSYLETIFISYWKPSLTFYTQFHILIVLAIPTCLLKLIQLFSLTREKSLRHVQLSAIPWTVAYQASPSMGFSRQEYWSGLPFPSPGDLPDPGIKPRSPTLQVDSLPAELPGKPHVSLYSTLIHSIHSTYRSLFSFCFWLNCTLKTTAL